MSDLSYNGRPLHDIGTPIPNNGCKVLWIEVEYEEDGVTRYSQPSSRPWPNDTHWFTVPPEYTITVSIDIKHSFTFGVCDYAAVGEETIEVYFKSEEDVAIAMLQTPELFQGAVICPD